MEDIHPVAATREPSAADLGSAPQTSGNADRLTDNGVKSTLATKTRLLLRSREAWKVFACYYSLVGVGWNEASIGPLLPSIQQTYGLGYTVVSTLFIAQCVGYIFAGVTNNRFTYRFGLGRMITIGALLQCIVYAVCIAPPPFPVLPCVYILLGAGVSFQDAGASVFAAGLPDAHKKLSYLQGFFGLGGIIAPLCSTAFIQAGIKWSYFFSISLTYSVTNACLLYFTFWHEGNGGTPISRKGGFRASESQAIPPPASVQDRLIFTNRIVWVGAVIMLFYVGAHISLSGFLVAFLKDERGGPVSVGYVSTGLWTGLTAGCMILPKFSNWIGHYRAMFLYIGIAVGLEISIWLSKSLVGNAVAFSLVGFFIGPVFALLISVVSDLIPRELHAGAVGFIIASGSLGSGAFPYAVGALAGRYGTWVLQPVVISLLVCMACLWALLGVLRPADGPPRESQP